MNFLQLKYFKTIAQYESISIAAEKLFITQPSLSQMLIKLENELGCKLFNRINNRLIINEYGIVFLKHANSILSEIDMLEKEFNELMNKKAQTLQIASNNYTLLYSYIMPFLQGYPSICVEQNLLNKTLLEKSLLSERIDFVISNLLLENDLLDKKVIESDRYFILVPITHELYGKDSVTIDDIKLEKFVASPKIKNTPRFIDDLFDKSNFTPNIIFQGDTGLQLQMFRSLNALKIHLASQIPNEIDFKAVPINHPQANININMYWLKNKKLASTSELFYSFINKYYNKN